MDSYWQIKKGGVNVESKFEELIDIDTAIAYAQLAVHMLQHSGAEITPKELQNEIKMLHNKFATKEVKRLVNVILKGKK